VGVVLLLMLFGLLLLQQYKNRNILDTLASVDAGLMRTTENFVAKNQTAYDVFEAQMEKTPAKVRPFRDKAYEVKEKADQLTFDLQELKAQIVTLVDGTDAAALLPMDWMIGYNMKKTYSIETHSISGKGKTIKPSQLMIVDGEGKRLREKIDAYREFLISLTDDANVQKSLNETLNTELNFALLPAIAVITNLTRMQTEVRNTEFVIIQNLLSQIGATDTRVNKMEAIVLTKTNYVTKGDNFEARILLAAYDSLQKPEIILGPYRRTTDGYEIIGEGTILPYDAKGRAIITCPATSTGNFKVEGLLRMITPDGVSTYPFTSEYQVGE